VHGALKAIEQAARNLGQQRVASIYTLFQISQRNGDRGRRKSRLFLWRAVLVESAESLFGGALKPFFDSIGQKRKSSEEHKLARSCVSLDGS